VALVYIAASIALSLIGGIVGVLLCIVGLIITLPLATLLTGLFQYHLYGQLAYAYPYPIAGGDIDPTLTSYTTTADMAPGVTPVVPPVSTDAPLGTDTPVGDSTDYPDSGVDNPAPPPAV
jgi:hypothetical protein